MRTAKIKRKTKETDIELELNLDGTGNSRINTPLKFLNHMLENFSKHSGFDITLKATGDVDVEDHHLVEDTAICLGEALEEALGDKMGICRMGYAIVPLDESLATVALDLSGRGYAVIDIPFSEFEDSMVGDLKKENIVHFLETFAMNGKFNLNVSVTGKNDHHKVESCFKALARAMQSATRVVGCEIPSTKGVI